MRQLSPQDFMLMLGDRDAIIFLAEEENQKLKEELQEARRCNNELVQHYSEMEAKLAESDAKIKELTNGQLVQSDSQ